MVLNRAITLKNVAGLVIVTFLVVCMLQIYNYNKRHDQYKPSADFFKKLHMERQLDQKETLQKKQPEPPVKDNGTPLLKNSNYDDHPVSSDQQKPASPLKSSNLDKSNNRNMPENLPAQTKDEGKDDHVSKPVVSDGDAKIEPRPVPGNVDWNDIGKNSPTSDEKITGDKCVFGRNKARENKWLERDARTTKQTSQKAQERAEHVKTMMMHAWSGYRRYAWGANELAPEIKRPHDGVFHGTRMGLTIVDSLDTLWIMGMFEEVERGKQWIMRNLTAAANVSVEVSVFEFNIRYVGGLLAMYALTNECEYKQLATMCADKLVPAFNTTHGIPVGSVNLKSGFDNSYGNYGTAGLAELGTIHLEFVYLSAVTGDPKYRKLVENVREKVVKARIDGLYGNTFYLTDASFSRNDMVISLGGAGDSFYEYLFKSFLQTGGKDVKAKNLYFDAMQTIIKVGLLKTSPSGLKYFGKKGGLNGHVYSTMEHLTCFIGGMIGLSAEFSKNSSATMELGEELGRTCHESYVRSGSGIGPESFNFESGKEAQTTTGDRSYHLRPEVVETWYFLQRLTHKAMYREWSWAFITALEKYCKVENGYAGLHDVYLKHFNNGQPTREDIQQSFFLAETLKYLYLIYKDDELLPLKDWVFTTEAHPLPVLHSSTGIK